MRSIVLALAFLAPTAAALAATPVAAPADYTTPNVKVHAIKPQAILVTFRSSSAEPRVLVIDNKQYALHFGKMITAPATIGSSVRVYSNQNSKLDGKQFMQVAAGDDGRIIPVR